MDIFKQKFKESKFWLGRLCEGKWIVILIAPTAAKTGDFWTDNLEKSLINILIV